MKKPIKGYKPQPVQLFARPHDGKCTPSWVVECYDSTGAWLWVHYGIEPMTKAQAKKLARDWFKQMKVKP
jgi:hypothetical protein